MDSKELERLLTQLIDRISALMSVYAQTARELPAMKGLLEFLGCLAVDLGGIKGRLTGR